MNLLHESTSHVHDILSSKLKQHWLVKELIQSDVISQPFSSSRLDREFPSQGSNGLLLEGSDYN